MAICGSTLGKTKLEKILPTQVLTLTLTGVDRGIGLYFP
jgi:hypothetical protein